MHHLLDVGRFTLGKHHNGIEYSPILILMRIESTFPGLAFCVDRSWSWKLRKTVKKFLALLPQFLNNKRGRLCTIRTRCGSSVEPRSSTDRRLRIKNAPQSHPFFFNVFRFLVRGLWW
jgi:hypothetical protein